MKIKKLKILLFIDNCGTNPDLQMSNVKTVLVPKNTTSKLQPTTLELYRTSKWSTERRWYLIFYMNFDSGHFVMIGPAHLISLLNKTLNLLSYSRPVDKMSITVGN